MIYYNKMHVEFQITLHCFRVHVITVYFCNFSVHNISEFKHPVKSEPTELPSLHLDIMIPLTFAEERRKNNVNMLKWLFRRLINRDPKIYSNGKWKQESQTIAAHMHDRNCE